MRLRAKRSCARGTRVTFAEFDRRTDQLAAVLNERGVRAGDRVLLFVANGVAWPLLCLAVMKLGALVVPVSTRLTEHEVAFLIRDAEPRVLCVSDELQAVAERATAAGSGGRFRTIRTIA